MLGARGNRVMFENSSVDALTRSAALHPADADHIASTLRSLGLRCVSSEPGRRYGLEVDVWSWSTPEGFAALSEGSGDAGEVA